MVRKVPTAARPKPTKSASTELQLNPKKASTSKSPQDDHVDGRKLSTAKSNHNATEDKPNNTSISIPRVEVETSISAPPTSFAARPRTTRKRSLDAPTSDAEPSATPTSTANKKRRSITSKKGYAPPSTYAHLPPLTDTIVPRLLVLFVGLNPGIQTATLGHPYAHPSNHYWRFLHTSGLTPDRRLAPSEYVTLPEKYRLGNTNIVSRATKDGAQLSKGEMVEGAGILSDKIAKYQPECVCFVGKSIWEAVWKWKYGVKMKAGEFKYGWQGEGKNLGGSKGGWGGARVFVATSTSGLAASLSLKQKEEIWGQLGGWVEERRREDGAVGMTG